MGAHGAQGDWGLGGLRGAQGLGWFWELGGAKGANVIQMQI